MGIYQAAACVTASRESHPSAVLTEQPNTVMCSRLEYHYPFDGHRRNGCSPLFVVGVLALSFRGHHVPPHWLVVEIEVLINCICNFQGTGKGHLRLIRKTLSLIPTENADFAGCFQNRLQKVHNYPVFEQKKDQPILF